MTVGRFVKESAKAGPFREFVALYAQANLLQIMQGTACNALHDVKQRCCRWLLQTQDRVGSREFLFAASGVRRHLRKRLGAAAASYGQLRRLVDAGFIKRIMWGSDQPVTVSYWVLFMQTAER